MDREKQLGPVEPTNANELEERAWPHIRNGAVQLVAGTLLYTASYEARDRFWPVMVVGAVLAIDGLKNIVRGDKLHNRAQRLLSPRRQSWPTS